MMHVQQHSLNVGEELVEDLVGLGGLRESCMEQEDLCAHFSGTLLLE